MVNNDFVGELNNYLKARDKDNFLKRYNEIIKDLSPNSAEYVDLKLVRITYEFLFVGDFEKMFADINKLEPLIFANASDINKIKFLVNKGIVLGRLKRFDEAIAVYNQSLEYCDNDDMVIYKIDILTNMGVIFFRKSEPNKSLKYYLKAYDLNKKFNCQIKVTTILVNIGVIYLNLAEYDKAIYYFELCLKTIPSSREYTKLSIFFNLIISYSFVGDYESSNKMIELSQAISSDFSQNDELSFHKALAIYYSNKKELTNAIEEYNIVLSRLKGIAYAKERVIYRTEIGLLYLEMQNYDECSKIIESIDSDAQLENFATENSEFLSLKVSYYSYVKDFEKALKYSQLINGIKTKEHIALEKQYNHDLTLPIDPQCKNISLDAYDEKISELENTNKELIEKEKLLIESLNELRKEANVREKLISIISHDLRAPLGNIILLLEMLEDFKDENERKEIVAEVIEGMKQAFSLTNELVDWAKEIIAVKQSSLSYLNVRDILLDIEQLFKQQLQAKNIVIINNLSTEELIFSHKASIKTCFRNIVQNAIKYSEPYSRIEVNQEVNSDSVTYSVKDYGKGLTTEELKGLFDVSKISTLGTSAEEGIGIGLLLVKELIVKSEGSIKCTSNIGEGTTFSMTFPIEPNLTHIIQ